MSKMTKSDKKEKIAAMTDKQRRKFYLKKAIIYIFATLAILAAVYFILKAVAPDKGELHKNVQIDEQYDTFTPFSANWDKNVDEDEQYKLLSTDVMYGEGDGGSLFPAESISDSLHEGHRFFEMYFDMLKKGDYEAYSQLFAESYDEKKGFEKNISRQFPPQMVYDITVREMGRFGSEYKGKPCTRGVYLVDYKIFKNDGLFRKDIGFKTEIDADISRPLIFELITFGAATDSERTLIHNLYTASSIK